MSNKLGPFGKYEYRGSEASRMLLRVIGINALTGERIRGICFCLSDGSHRQCEETSEDGSCVFHVFPCVNYTLAEVRKGLDALCFARSHRLCFNSDGAMLHKGCCHCPCVVVEVYPSDIFSFSFRKVDAQTGAALPGASFILFDGQRIAAQASSDLWGLVQFFHIPPMKYRLVETDAPPGYRSEHREYDVEVFADGLVLINGIPACFFCLENTPLSAPFFLSFPKLALGQASYNQKGLNTMAIPLQGATFELQNSDGIVLLTATSDASGVVALGNVSPGVYTLVETGTPPGFIPGGPYTVVVSADGEITVDGLPLADFEATNLPYPNLTFTKTDSEGDPLMGAIFALDDLSGSIQLSTSTIDGDVTFFGLHPGTYLLTEDAAPFGYLPTSSSYVVEVEPDGTVTIGGLDPAGFTVVNETGPNLSFVKLDLTPQSLAPLMNPVGSGLLPVTGTGVPGSTITITWPDFSTTDVFVALDNTWSAVPPVSLSVSETVSATQETPNHLPSDSVSEIVQPSSASPTVNEVFVGDIELTGTGISDSTISIFWSDGSSTYVVVSPGGTWSALPPLPFTLGAEISVTQTSPGMLPSAPETTIVQQNSPTPTINAVFEGDLVIGGSGVEGALIEINWADGPPSTATVGSYGTWVSAAPSTLVAGQEISATQTVPGMITSAPVTVTVGI